MLNIFISTGEKDPLESKNLIIDHLADSSVSHTWKDSMLTTWRPRDEVRDNENCETSSDDVTSLEKG